jgi:hypothetical protein
MWKKIQNLHNITCTMPTVQSSMLMKIESALRGITCTGKFQWSLATQSEKEREYIL